MATVSDITTLANATAAAHGYTYATYTVTSQGQVQQVVSLTKRMAVPNSGFAQEFGGYGAHTTLTTAKTNALASLNANRRHRYAGAPGQPSGGTVTTNQHGDALTVDGN